MTSPGLKGWVSRYWQHLSCSFVFVAQAFVCVPFARARPDILITFHPCATLSPLNRPDFRCVVLRLRGTAYRTCGPCPKENECWANVQGIGWRGAGATFPSPDNIIQRGTDMRHTDRPPSSLLARSSPDGTRQ